MKTSWPTLIGIAALVLSLLGLVIQMNQVSGDDARQIERRLSVIEGRIGPAEKAIDRADIRQDKADATLADHNLRLDRLERHGR